MDNQPTEQPTERPTKVQMKPPHQMVVLRGLMVILKGLIHNQPTEQPTEFQIKMVVLTVVILKGRMNNRPMRVTVKIPRIRGHRPLTIKHKIMVPQITMEEVQTLLNQIKQTHNHKEITKLTQTLREVIQAKEEQQQRKEEGLQVQVIQLKEEVRRLNHL